MKNKQLQRQIDALTPQQKGALGESIAKDTFAGQFDEANPRSSYAAISGKTRITDITLNNQSIVETKFVKKQGLTSQLKDGIAQAKAEKAAYHLVTAPETKLSGPLQTAIAEGQVVHHTMSESAIARTITTL
ncbi:putative toxin [Corynebacterium auriscanis]|uniref:putative toxin n=1 Tax=Corynebacterium auriscanis TaxID=99807 RepID=UPI000A41B4FF|nr:putative toxin [Corynebacterium auriscanis]